MGAESLDTVLNPETHTACLGSIWGVVSKKGHLGSFKGQMGTRSAEKGRKGTAECKKACRRGLGDGQGVCGWNDGSAWYSKDR